MLRFEWLVITVPRRGAAPSKAAVRGAFTAAALPTAHAAAGILAALFIDVFSPPVVHHLESLNIEEGPLNRGVDDVHRE